MGHKAHLSDAELEAQHQQNVAARKAALDPAVQAQAAAYFLSLDVSHQAAFYGSNPHLVQALVGYSPECKAAIQNVENSYYQTADGRDIDRSVTEPVFQPSVNATAGTSQH